MISYLYSGLVPLRNILQDDTLCDSLHKECRRGRAQHQSIEFYDPERALPVDTNFGNISETQKQ